MHSPWSCCSHSRRPGDNPSPSAQHANLSHRVEFDDDHLGFVIPYRGEGGPRKYLPDFIVELTAAPRVRLIVEIKGEERPDDPKKAAAAQRWVRAVNRDGRFGTWEYRYLRQPADLARVLTERTAMALPAELQTT